LKNAAEGFRRPLQVPAVRQAILELSLDHRGSDARIAENGFATSSGVSKSAKVVLAKISANVCLQCDQTMQQKRGV
jgi:hypothetical protein